MTTKRRLKLTTGQLDRRIAMLKRQMALADAKNVRAGLITQQRLDEIDAEIERNSQDAKVGDVIPWDGEDYRIEQFVDGGTILTKVNKNARPSDHNTWTP